MSERDFRKTFTDHYRDGNEEVTRETSDRWIEKNASAEEVRRIPMASELSDEERVYHDDRNADRKQSAMVKTDYGIRLFENSSFLLPLEKNRIAETVVEEIAEEAWDKFADMVKLIAAPVPDATLPVRVRFVVGFEVAKETLGVVFVQTAGEVGGLLGNFSRNADIFEQNINTTVWFAERNIERLYRMR